GTIIAPPSCGALRGEAGAGGPDRHATPGAARWGGGFGWGVGCGFCWCFVLLGCGWGVFGWVVFLVGWFVFCLCFWWWGLGVGCGWLWWWCGVWFWLCGCWFCGFWCFGGWLGWLCWVCFCGGWCVCFVCVFICSCSRFLLCVFGLSVAIAVLVRFISSAIGSF
ncbi:hypothetical protein RA276_27740, partial [Pseudomonas syringae pv. tagetis]|uniref:hypothetical protein n=1 Tax=Pseudomonas syringae group genomosp. 7 TaxID=251699 RepID=UPI003770746B